MLPDLDLATNYRSGRDALLDDFYIPCLQEACLYDRAVGFFSSSLLHVVAIAFSDFALRDGHMRLLCSPALSPEDFAAMKSAHEMAHLAQDSVRAELCTMIASAETLPATKLLATLITGGVLDVRIAFSTNPRGIFHDKLGVFADLDGRRVTFVGSANETWAAWGLNHESFEVFCSWRGERELLRTRNHAYYFDNLWDGHERDVRVERLDAVTRDDLLNIADPSLEHAISEVRLPPKDASGRVARTLLPHQMAVLENWEQSGHRGIVNFATGAGKTLTGIHAIKLWTSQRRPALILVPGAELHGQWAGELRQESPDARVLVAGSGASLLDWHRLLPAFCRPTSSTPHIVLATMQTFATAAFQERLAAASDLLVVVDELHRAGSRRVLDALTATPMAATLGLSATYRRQWDIPGTDRLVALMGPVLEPVIGLAEAIALHLLVPYDYRLHTLTLEDDELAQYKEMTDRIRRVAAQSATAGPDVDEYLRLLVLQRARILKQARNKVQAATQVLLDDFHDGDRWLVYCDSQTQLRELVASCQAQQLPVMEYHSTMAGHRHAVLESLGGYGGIVVAIRCLDEGVDIPICDRALILASSTVEREYIQRRGRVLRRAPQKTSATIHDLLLTDDGGGALTRGEAKRALEFARLARNPGARAQLALLLALSSDVEGVDFAYLPDDAPNSDDEAS